MPAETPPARPPQDLRVLYATTFLRAVATALTGVTLGYRLGARGFDLSEVGDVVGAGLAGAAVATLLVTLAGERARHPRVLVLLSLLCAGGCATAAFLDLPLAAAVAAFAGMVNGAGRDRGALLVLEQAAIPAVVDDRARTRAFAIYNLWQDAGGALGDLVVWALASALLGTWALGLDAGAVAPVQGRVGAIGLLASASLFVVAAGLYLRLSPRVREAAPGARARLSPASRGRLARISALFALDSLGGGLLAHALFALFFTARFGVGIGTVGLLFAGARVLNALSHLGAAWLARRIGLVNTMVFTHVPSSLLLATVPIAPDFATAAVLFLLREGLVEMDVPTRQSYVMAIVRPEERTVASGVTHLVRMGGWAVAAWVAGRTMEDVSFSAPLWIAAGLKIAYDVLLYVSFRRVRPPEEE